MEIREGGPSDAGTVLELFDEAVARLVASGRMGGWESRPFSTLERRVAQATEWAASGGLRIALLDGEVAGALVLGARPPWVSPVAKSERYIEALVTSPRHAGRGVGGALVRRAAAEAREAGAVLLRVDCWADAPELVTWYERQGFRRSGTFELDGWHGQVLTLRVDGPVAEPTAAASSSGVG
ncbi:GNAT family N-acetyltransferase [Candidatus Solirubrobacter pratensis]|uniref:GNAT family N-acetyltransferase n=1 Tax=Candidatus Solirubrobacter pratensis TaxID=1298857 RepID=UPI0004119BE7|nr:GNAT family N-acetyltransferase [Candidatus Solirubrobacter pratensis]